MKRALVFGGGGSRGAYEMGAWRALRELGYTFDIVTGTSIGALNGAAYVQGDYELAEELWANATAATIMTNGISLDYSLEALFKQRDAIGPFVKEYINSKGADIEPLKELLSEKLNEERFFASDIDFGLVTVAYPSLTPVEVFKKDIKPGYLKQWVLASASCFPAFPVGEVDGNFYIDGGYYCNLPIETAFRLGASEVIAIGLAPKKEQDKYSKNPLVTFICPKKGLGSILAFDPKIMEENLKQGYEDTMKALGGSFGLVYTFKPKNEETCNEMAVEFCRLITLLETGRLPTNAIAGQLSKGQGVVGKLRKSKALHTPFDYFIYGLEVACGFLGLAKDEIYFIEDLPTTLLGALAKGLAAQKPERAATCTKIMAVLALFTESEWPIPREAITATEEELLTALLIYAMEMSAKEKLQREQALLEKQQKEAAEKEAAEQEAAVALQKIQNGKTGVVAQLKKIFSSVTKEEKPANGQSEKVKEETVPPKNS